MPPTDKVIYGFIAGEISPDFYGRSDIGKYDFGLRLCRNFIVDWCGGIKSRSGFEFCAETPYFGQAVSLHRFRATEDDYRLEFTAGKLRFMRYKDYILEEAKVITSVEEGLFASSAHGFSSGDLVKIEGDVELGGRYFIIEEETTNAFRIRVPGFSSYVLAEEINSGATVSRVYTVAVPYDEAAVKELRIEQSYERFIITHPRYPQAKLTFVSDTSWTYVPMLFGSEVAAPGLPVLTPSEAGTAGVGFAITAVKNGVESVASPYAFNILTIDYSVEEGSMRVNWPAVSGATEYNVYRTLILPTGSDISHAQAVGYIGRASGPQFIDTNIVADFTKTPPLYYNPFVNNAILQIDVTAGGSGYTNLSVVSITDATGSGFIGYPVVSPDGELLSIVIVNGGKNYSSPVITVSVGTGATLSFELTPAEGNFPALCRLFQQRMLFAATKNEPMRVWASKPGTLENFDLSQVVNAGDGYSFSFDSQEVRPIQHLLALRHGLLAFTSEQITLLRAEEGKALSAVNAVAEPQVYKGAGKAEPIAIDLDVIFAQRGSRAVNAMFYTEYTNSFALQDLSVLSKHMFGPGREVAKFAWQSEPHKVLWCLLTNGELLSLTYEREQEVFAWARHDTQGKFLDIIVVREGNDEVLYAVAERCLRGRWVTTHERMFPRFDDLAENYFGVDSGVRKGISFAEATLFYEESELRFSPSRPEAIDVGDAIYFAGGKFIVTELISSDRVTYYEERPANNKLHASEKEYYRAPGTWGYAKPSEIITGLWHLEGEEVSVNFDGDAVKNLTVQDGRIELQNPAFIVSVGLSYHAEAWTLPPTFSGAAIEGKLRDIVSAKVLLQQTRGIELGWDADHLVEMKDRQEEGWGQELALRSDFPEITFSSPWDERQGVFIRQTYPLPAHILSAVVKLEVED